MTRRRPVLGALLLCALCLCGFGVADASAATLYVCQEVAKGGGKWEDAKCEKVKENGNFGTVAPIPGVATSINGTATTTTTIGIFTPVHQDIQCTKLTTTGLTVNKTVGEQMENAGEKITFKFAGCTFKKEGCKVKGGQFELHEFEIEYVRDRAGRNAGEILAVQRLRCWASSRSKGAWNRPSPSKGR